MSKPRWPGLGAAFFMMVMLGACAHVPVATVAKLRHFKLENTDPERLRIAVRHATGLAVAPRGARLVITERHKITGELRTSETFVLVPSSSTSERLSLAEELRSGTAISIYRFEQADIARMRELQARVRARKNAGTKTIAGDMSVFVDGCRTGEALPTPILITTYLGAAEFDGFVPLTRNVDLSKAMARAGAPVDQSIGKCPML